MQFSAENDYLTLGDKKTFRDKTVTGNKYMYTVGLVVEKVLVRESNQIKSNQFISETADSKIETQDNDNVQPLTEVRKGCCQL